jgi:hypothetical protein
MKTVVALVVYTVLGAAYPGLAAADQQTPSSSARARLSYAPGDELHFVSVLTVDSEVTAVNPAQRLVGLKGPEGKLLTLEAKKDQDLTALKVGDRVEVKFFEAAWIGKSKTGEAVPVHSFNDGILGSEAGGSSGKPSALTASVERIDPANQEITLKGPEGSIETIMVANSAGLDSIKVGNQVVFTQPQALALSIEKRD